MGIINSVLNENIAAARYKHLVLAPACKDFVVRTAFYINGIMTYCVAAGTVCVIADNLIVAAAAYLYSVVARAAIDFSLIYGGFLRAVEVLVYMFMKNSSST